MCRPVHSCNTIIKGSAFLDRPGTRLPCEPLPDARMENDFFPSIPFTLGYSATSKSTDSLEAWILVMVQKGLHLTFLKLIAPI